MTTHKNATTSRRRFLKTTAAASVGVLAAPYFVPDSALGLSGKVAPSDRLVMGCIGTGGQGQGNMNGFMGFDEVQVVAVSDTDGHRQDEAREKVNAKYGNQDCQGYRDFRELVARKDIDLISVATPDHWHALASVAALNAGKDVYCEKPLANSVGEGRAICDAAKKNDRILQTGSHERSTESIRYACELVRNGRIGKLHTLRINLPCTDGHHLDAMKMTTLPPEQPVPEFFDYNMWLGHTPVAPYNERRCHFWWRFILAYGGGEMTDRGAHVIDIGQLGAGMDHTGPVEFRAEGKASKTSLYNAFFQYKFEHTYANGLKMIGSSDGERGVKFEGDDGWIFIHIHGGKLEASKPSFLEEQISESEVHLGRSPGHHRNFLDCVKSRQQPYAAAEIGHRTASLCHLTNIAMRVGRPLKWNPETETILDDPEASALLMPKMREPWHI